MIYEITNVTTSDAGISVTLRWDYGKGINIETPEPFPDTWHLRYYVNKEVHEVLFTRYRLLLSNCQKCIDKYPTKVQLESITYLQKVHAALYNRKFDLLCRNIIALQHHLINLLPPPGHYQNMPLSNELNKIIAFAEKHQDFEFENLIKKATTT